MKKLLHKIKTKKQILVFLMFALIGLSANRTNAQCAYTGSSIPMGTLNITTTSQTLTGVLNGYYYAMNLIVDDTINFQSVSGNPFEITIWDNTMTVINFSNTANFQYHITTAGTYYVHFSDPTCLEDSSPLDDFYYIIYHQTGGGGGTLTGTLTDVLGASSIFVQGISTVNNTFTVTDPVATSVSFTADSAGTILSSYTDNSPVGGVFTWSNVDMGSLKPNTQITASITDGVNTITSYEILNIVPTPDWLLRTGSTATVTGVNTSTQDIDIDCNLGLEDFIKHINDSIKLIGGKDFGIRNTYTFHTVYNYANPIATTATNDSYNYTFVALSTDVYNESLTNSMSGTNPVISLATTVNPQLNLGCTGSFTYTKNILDKNTPNYKIPTPIPGIVVSLSAGLKIDGAIVGKVVYGIDASNSQYGFINNGNGDVSGAAIGGVVKGTISGGISFVCDAIANVRGTLTATGKIGASYQFQTQPAGFVDSVKFGGSLSLDGKITTDNIARKLWRFFNSEPQDPKVLIDGHIWPSYGDMIFGDGYPASLPTMLVANNHPNSRTFINNWIYDTPEFGAQPNIGTRGNNLYTVWMEADTNSQHLFFAKYDTLTNCFIGQREVVANDSSISNPKVSLMSNGDAIITWTQNRYDENNLPTGITMKEFLDAQDIWFAIYDNATDNIFYRGQLADNSNTALSRSEGEATVTSNGNGECLITWSSRSQSSNDADIYSSTISRVGAVWTQTVPASISNTIGSNTGVKVAYGDSTHASAIWISDVDNADSTYNNQIMVSYYTSAGGWQTPQVFLASQQDVNYKEIDLDFNKNYGAFAVTLQYYDTTSSSFYNAIMAYLYDNSTQQWLTGTGQVFFPPVDSLNFFKLPKVSIDESGLATIVYQKQSLVNDSINFDKGKLMMFTNDITADNIWNEVYNTNILSDTNSVVWFMNTGFTSNRNLFVLTQETDTIVGSTNNSPVNGVRFGGTDLGLVLRVAQVDNTNSLTTGTYPVCIPTGLDNGVAKQIHQEMLSQNYPNPASNYTFIDYTIKKQDRYTIKIYDITGRMVLEVLNTELRDGVYKTYVDLSSLDAGVYIYTLSSKDVLLSKRFVIAK